MTAVDCLVIIVSIFYIIDLESPRIAMRFALEGIWRTGGKALPQDRRLPDRRFNHGRIMMLGDRSRSPLPQEILHPLRAPTPRTTHGILHGNPQASDPVNMLASS
jgi:hypothetical protein